MKFIQTPKFQNLIEELKENFVDNIAQLTVIFPDHLSISVGQHFRHLNKEDQHHIKHKHLYLAVLVQIQVYMQSKIQINIKSTIILIS